MRAFARFRSAIWCMDLAYVDELAKESNGLKYLLVHQDLFDRTVNAKGMKTKGSQETVKAFSSMITKSYRPKKICVDKGTELAGAFKKFCAAEGILVYSTMSEIKAAFAERTIHSLKNIFYHCMEDFGYKYIHKLRQFITTLSSRRNSSIDMKPNTVKICDFMSILYSKPIREFKKPTFKISNRVQISKYDMPFITDIVEAMNTLIQERKNHNETCITVKVSRRTQKVVIMLANDSSGLAFCSTDLDHTFGNNVGKHFGVLMNGKGPHEPQFAYDIVRIHSLMIYSDLVEYNIVGDTKAHLL